MNEPSNFCEWPCNNPDAQSAQASVTAQTRGITPREEVGSKKGISGRDLLFPKYQIHNEWGVLGNKTARTDIIHRGGYAEYDTHNL